MEAIKIHEQEHLALKFIYKVSRVDVDVVLVVVVVDDDDDDASMKMLTSL